VDDPYTTGKVTVGPKNTNVIPADISQTLGPQAVIGEIDFWAQTLFVPVSNGTHGAIVTTTTKLAADKVSGVVSEPLTWVVVDYGTELVYAGSKNAKQLSVFQASDLQMKGKVSLSTALKDAVGAALKEPTLLYIASSSGAMHVVNVTSGDVTSTVGADIKTPVHGLANIWGYGEHGTYHFATSTQIEHYDNCASRENAGTISI
jgi:hypothetical protein